MLTALLLCAAARVVDGDTIACSSVGRVRLVAIDAADKVSSLPCREHIGNHVCDDAKAVAATAEMQRFTAGKRITFRIVGFDAKYRREVAQMFANGADLQCHMLRVHQARYLPAYDKPLIIARRCPATVRKADR
jgi:endonuclease YncB( thermonuclease family)